MTGGFRQALCRSRVIMRQHLARFEEAHTALLLFFGPPLSLRFEPFPGHQLVRCQFTGTYADITACRAACWIASHSMGFGMAMRLFSLNFPDTQPIAILSTRLPRLVANNLLRVCYTLPCQFRPGRSPSTREMDHRVRRS